jgi:hypothetical protein
MQLVNASKNVSEIGEQTVKDPNRFKGKYFSRLASQIAIPLI